MIIKLEDVQDLIDRAWYWKNKGFDDLEAIKKAEIDLEGD